MTIPERLAAAKKRDGLSGDDQAAALFGVKQQTFNKWRRGKQRPGEEHLPKIAEWTQTDLAIIQDEWHAMGPNGLTEEQAEQLAVRLNMLVETLTRVADQIEAGLAANKKHPDPPADRKDQQAGRSRQRGR